MEQLINECTIENEQRVSKVEDVDNKTIMIFKVLCIQIV